jgi:hypothetical protein
LRRLSRAATIGRVEQPIEHREVTTIMALLGDIKNDVRRIRTLLEDENGEEEEEDREPHR